MTDQIVKNRTIKKVTRSPKSESAVRVSKQGNITKVDLKIQEVITSSNSEVIEPRKYIQERYPRWLEHAEYHCSMQGFIDESYDVLNEVLCSVLKKDDSWLIYMCNTDSKCGRYKEMDLYVLRLIQLNVKSPTAPYRNKYKNRYNESMVNTEIDFSRLDIEDEPMDLSDDPAEELKRHRLVMWVFKALDLTEFERKVFEHKFVMGESLCSWSSPKNRRELYITYSRVRDAIRIILYRRKLITKEPVLTNSSLTSKNVPIKRVRELVDGFFKNRTIHTKK